MRSKQLLETKYFQNFKNSINTNNNFNMLSTSKSKPLSVITGAGGGIGKAIALECAERGYNIALIDLNPQSLNDIKSQLSLKYENQIFKSYKCDLTNSEALKQTVEKIKTDFNGSVELLFNNAGVYRPFPLLSTDLSLLRKHMNINFWSMVEVTQLFLPLLKNSYSNSGKIARIINTSSRMGLSGSKLVNNMYSVTKHTVVAYSEAIIHELKVLGLGDKIKCHILLPAGVNTNFVSNSKRLFPSVDFPSDKIVAASLKSAMSPKLVAKYVWYGIENELTYIHTHYDLSYAILADKFEAIATGKANKFRRNDKAALKKVDRSKIIGPTVDINLFSKL